MKLTLETSDVNLVSAWKPAAIRIGDKWLCSHLILSAQDILLYWPVTSPKTLKAADLQPAINLNPKIVLLGTGRHLVLPNSDLMTDLAIQGVGLEIMDTPAACRTYNLLVHEGRDVVAALFIN